MVQILNTIETYGTHFSGSDTPGPFLVGMAAAIIIGCIFFICTLDALCDGEWLTAGLSFGAIILVAVIAVGLGSLVGQVKNKTPDIIYKVTVDDNISYKEFTQKYEVLDQEGLIYTVKERK